MSTVLGSVISERAYSDRVATCSGEVRRRVQLVMWSSQPERRLTERRRERRIPFPYPIYVSPLAPDGSAVPGKTFVVLGRHLSELGFDFYHREAVPDRRVIATFRCGASLWVSLLADLTWCRFRKHGWYENGGRFLQPAETPPDLTSCEADYSALLAAAPTFG